jgi:hypothetical protein
LFRATTTELGTVPEFIREGIRGIEPVIQELILSARKDVHILAYLFTPQATRFIDLSRRQSALLRSKSLLIALKTKTLEFSLGSDR